MSRYIKGVKIDNKVYNPNPIRKDYKRLSIKEKKKMNRLGILIM